MHYKSNTKIITGPTARSGNYDTATTYALYFYFNIAPTLNEMEDIGMKGRLDDKKSRQLFERHEKAGLLKICNMRKGGRKKGNEDEG